MTWMLKASSEFITLSLCHKYIAQTMQRNETDADKYYVDNNNIF